jgi:hypothetical protein
MDSKQYSTTDIVEHDGQKKTIKEWAQSIGLNCKTLCNRLNRGHPIDRALTSPTKPSGERSIVAVRTKAIDVLITALYEIGQEDGGKKIKTELRAYVDKYGLIKTYQDLAAFFPKSANVALDGGQHGHERQVATVIMYGSPPPPASDPNVIVMGD